MASPVSVWADRMPDKMLESMLDRMPGKMLDRMLECMSGTHKMSDRMLYLRTPNIYQIECQHFNQMEC